MSKRRNVGDQVWLRPWSGFCGESHKYPVILKQNLDIPCFECEDEDCVEWDVEAQLPDDKKAILCHVCECQMFDQKQKVE